MKIIGLIPARGGSKGIPRKNLSPFLGTTLLGHKINQAQRSTCDEIWVSTEDQEIKAESLRNGAQVIDRPDALSQDESSTDSMLLHAVEYLNCDLSDVVVLLQITSPLIKVESMNLTIDKLISNPDLNSVITVRESHPFMWTTKDGKFWEPEGHSRDARPRRQDLLHSGWETGGCYAIRVSAILDQKVRYPAPTSCINVSHLEAMDIDTFEDLSVSRKVSGSIEG
jgi:N-acylneuraminate cytidylyltransferase